MENGTINNLIVLDSNSVRLLCGTFVKLRNFNIILLVCCLGYFVYKNTQERKILERKLKEREK